MTEISASTIIYQHIAWLQTYVNDMTEDNWRDQLDYASRQIDGLLEDFKAFDWTEHQAAKLADFVACLEEYEGMRCDSTTRKVREAAFDFALAIVLDSKRPSFGART